MNTSPSTSTDANPPKSRFWLFLLAFAALVHFTTACGPSNDQPLVVSLETDGPTIARIEVDPTTTQVLDIGSAVAYDATAFDAEGRVIEDASFTWASSDLAVATVTNRGIATARGPGQTEITAMSGNVSGRAVLTVSQVANP